MYPRDAIVVERYTQNTGKLAENNPTQKLAEPKKGDSIQGSYSKQYVHTKYFRARAQQAAGRWAVFFFAHFFPERVRTSEPQLLYIDLSLSRSCLVFNQDNLKNRPINFFKRLSRHRKTRTPYVLRTKTSHRLQHKARQRSSHLLSFPSPSLRQGLGFPRQIPVQPRHQSRRKGRSPNLTSPPVLMFDEALSLSVFVCLLALSQLLKHQHWVAQPKPCYALAHKACRESVHTLITSTKHRSRCCVFKDGQ